VGKVSYAAYIFHTPVIQLLTSPGGLYEALAPRSGQSTIPGFLFCSAITTGLTLMLAAVSWNFFEGPINALKDRFPYGKPPSPGTEALSPVVEATPALPEPSPLGKTS
jgi:peptidoglycan/LPS O-acetylase OafA/YrhL